MAPIVAIEDSGETKHATLDPQIIERLGMIYGNYVFVTNIYSINT